MCSSTDEPANIGLVKSLGADIAIDNKKEDFTKILSGYDLVLNSLDSETLEKSLAVLKPGGKRSQRSRNSTGCCSYSFAL